MNRQITWGVLASALLVDTACVSNQVGMQAPSESEIKQVRTRADHEALAVYYEREAQALQEKAKNYHQLADQSQYRGGANRILYAPRYKALARKYRDAEEENLRQAQQHRELAAEAKH